MNNQNLHKKAEETEILSADEIKISKMVGSLDRVSAPKDFDFRLKARIAARQQGYRTGHRQWLRYALPAGAASFVLAFGLYTTNFFAPPAPPENIVQTTPLNFESKTSPSHANSQNVAAVSSNTEINDGDTGIIANESPTESSGKELIYLAEKSAPPKKDLASRNKIEDNFNGSSVESVNLPIQILPPGINANASVKKIPDFEIGKMTATELLREIGVETDAGNKLTVKSVRPNSLADRSGVKAGDVVEAIDGEKIDGKNLAPKFSTGKTLTVSRSSKKVEINLKPN